MSTNKSSNLGVTYGVICGLASIVFGIILYLGGAKMFVHPIAYAAFLIPIVVAVLAANKQKKLNGGFLEFKDALRVTFMTFVIGGIMSSLFTFVLFNYIDVPFREALTQEASVKAAEMMKKFGATDEMIDAQSAEMMNKNSYSFSNTMLGFAFTCILYFLFSLIISAIVKKKSPQSVSFGQQ